MFGRIGCALGRHTVDRDGLRVVMGQRVGRCKTCATPLEESFRDVFVRPSLRDAELGPRLF